MMFRIGLTGGIASGKSTVANLLKNMGIPVINLDLISRQILMKGTPGYREVINVFGQTILTSIGEINRKELGKIIFNSPQKRKKLESITHPLILAKMEEDIKKIEDSGEEVVVVEVPLLIEVGMVDQFDQIWLVYVDKTTQLKRLKKRDDLNEEEAIARVKAQMSLDEKKAFADSLIINTGEVEELQEQIEKIWRDIKCQELL